MPASDDGERNTVQEPLESIFAVDRETGKKCAGYSFDIRRVDGHPLRKNGRYGGVTSIVLMFFGLLILMERKLIRYEITVAYFATIVVGYVPFYWDHLGFHQFFSWLSLGGLMLIGIFALNDCTTTPIDPKGRIIFGFGTGLLTLVLYRFGNSSYAMIFPVLMMNLTTPIFDRYLRPRVFSKPSWFREVEE